LALIVAALLLDVFLMGYHRGSHDKLQWEILRPKGSLMKTEQTFDIEKIFQIAKVCHEANRAYCVSLGDLTQLPWEGAPQWQRESAINGVKFHLTMYARKTIPTPWASHNSWMAEKVAAGWTYGPEKNEATKTHPCIVEFHKLPMEQRMKDYLFTGIVESFHRAETAIV